MPTEFIISGPKGSLDAWPAHAAALKCLQCYLASGASSECATCNMPGFCGLQMESGNVRVLPIDGATGFNTTPDRELLLITPSKKTQDVDLQVVQQLLVGIVRALGESVELYQAKFKQQAVEWVKIKCRDLSKL